MNKKNNSSTLLCITESFVTPFASIPGNLIQAAGKYHHFPYCCRCTGKITCPVIKNDID